MNIEHHHADGLDIVKVSGRFGRLYDEEGSSLEDVRSCLKAIIEDGGNLLLDFRDVDFIDSSGCGVLIASYKSIRSHGRRMALAALTRDVMAVMELTRFNQVFEIYPSAEAAAEALRGTPGKDAP